MSEPAVAIDALRVRGAATPDELAAVLAVVTRRRPVSNAGAHRDGVAAWRATRIAALVDHPRWCRIER